MNLSPAQHAQRLRNVEAIAATRRAATHCKHGHEFTPENTYYRPNGNRDCRICQEDRVWYSRRSIRWPR